MGETLGTVLKPQSQHNSISTIIKRAGVNHLNLVARGTRKISSATLSQSMLSDDAVEFSVSSNAVLDIKINDTVEIFGNTYRINSLPEVTKENSKSYIYKIRAQGLMYDLLRCKFFNADGEGFKTTTDFPLIANLEGFLLAVRNNMRRFSLDWEIGNFTNTETKMITFGDDTCLSALQKICQEFKTDFWVKNDGLKIKIHTGAFGSTLPIKFEYGKGKGLYKLNRKNVNDNDVINRLYVNGGNENIPAGYRAFSDNLKFSDAGYLEDPALIAEMGLKEGSIDFPDIYPKRTGTISALGSSKFKFSDASMDFDLNEKEADGVTTKYLIAGTSAKVHFNTGNLAGYEFEIKKGGYNHATKEFEIIPFTNTTGQKFPDETAEAFQFEVGDKYVLLDIVMPQTYIANAEAELLAKANEQFPLLKTAKVSYELEVDPQYIKSLNTPLSIGDYVQVVDPALGIDKVIRIQAITRNFISGDALTPFNYKITLADAYEISYASQMVMDITEVKNVISVTNLGNINLSQLGYRTTEELKNLVFDTDGYFDAENIKPFSIQTNMLTVGAQSQQLSCSVVFLVNNAGNPNQIETKPGALYSQTLNKTWVISGSSQTLPDPAARYVYGKCSKTGTVGTIYFSQEQIKFDQDPNDYYFLIGILHSITEGVRVLSITIGTTTINGGLIRTGIISSLDGQTYFNLNTNEIKGKITFTNDSPAFEQMNNAIVIGGRNYYKKTTPIYPMSGATDVQKTPTGFNVTGVPQNNGEVRVHSLITGNGKWTVSFEHQIEYFGYSLTIDICDLGQITLPANTDNKWKKFSHTVDVTNYGDGSLFNFIDIEGLTGQQHRFRNFKVEKGTKATDWTPAPEDIAQEIQTVQNYAETVNGLVSDISSDNKLTPSEKQQLKKEVDIIIAERPQLNSQATAYGITTARTAYQNAYNNLILFINPFLVNLNNTENVDGVTLRSYFTTYYTAKVNLLKAITDAIDNNFDGVYNVIDDLEAGIYTEINEIYNQVNGLGTYIDGAFSDGIISQAEAVAIEKYLNQLSTEKADVENKYNSVNANVYLSGTAKTNLHNEWANYSLQHGYLITSINDAIADGATTPAEKANVDAQFALYRTYLANLSTRFQEATKAIETAMIEAVQVGGRNLMKNSKNKPIVQGEGSSVQLANGFKVINAISYNSFGYHFKLEDGKQYTVSIRAKRLTEGSGNIHIYFNEENHYNVIPETENLTFEFKTYSLTRTAVGNGDVIVYMIFPSGEIEVEYIKIEQGNKATDWTPAPEDIDVAIAGANTNAANALAQAQNAANTAAAAAAVTSFMQTTIDGNVVSTGTLQVGNVNGANAGITGVSDQPNGRSVRFFAGANYAQKNTARWLVRDDGVEEQWINGVLIRQRGVIGGVYAESWFNLNGQLAKKITFTPQGKIQEEWYNNGVLAYQIGQNGIYYVSEIPESYTPIILIDFSTNASPVDQNALKNAIKLRIWQKSSDPTYFELRGSYEAFEYNAGRNVYSEYNKQFEGYKKTQSLNNNINDGWYSSEQKPLQFDGLNPNELIVPVTRFLSGKNTQTIFINIPTQGYYFNQF